MWAYIPAAVRPFLISISAKKGIYCLVKPIFKPNVTWSLTTKLNRVSFKFIVLFYCGDRFMFSSKTDKISHDLLVFPVYFLSIQKYIK